MDIQSLISSGKTEQALQLLEQLTPDAVLLQSRYNGAKRQWGMGMIDHSEWARTQSQINYAALEMYNAKAPKVLIVNAPTIVLNYFNFERQPGNDVGIVNKIFRTFRTMVEDMEYPEADINKGVEMLNDIFGLPELVAKVEQFKMSAYTKNTDAFRLTQRKALVSEILKEEADFKSTIVEIVADEQAKTGWKEAFRLLCEEPSMNRWKNTAGLISARIQDPIFDVSIFSKWAEIEADIDSIADGLFWKRKFEGKLADLKRFLQNNLH